MRSSAALQTLLWLSLLVLPAAVVAEAPTVVGLAAITSYDDGGVQATRVRAGALFSAISPQERVGVAAQTTQYSQSDWSRSVPGVFGLWRRPLRDTLPGIAAEGGVVDVAGRMRPVGDVKWSLQPARDTRIELGGAMGIVETQQAIEQALGYTHCTASVRQVLTDRVTVSGLVGYQPFDDGNERLHVRAGLDVVAVPEHGITAQVRWRHYRSSMEDVGGAYVNPARHDQWQAGLAMRTFVNDWVWSGALASGWENTDGNPPQANYLAEVRAEYPLGAGVRVGIHAGYSRAVGVEQAPDSVNAIVGTTLSARF